ncbi:restriction endonuclease subunit S [Agitococcus lubricus]|uniref:Type I restriction enzyme S subunit n=1 Tax=Agitococcus lubricus TaxID=1077255 RepID=A0A2T5ISF9_9GAMM|nr:restriction endonuclease subunit S [Agitococcus lubricus]PTQ86774.1 type I restriction enzyme S subunit [Agitococcus lubricus]
MKFNQMILDDILTFKRGHDLPHSQRVMGEIPVVSSSGITGFHNEYICDGEGVITGRYGTLGEIHYVNGKYWPLNTTLYVTDFKSNFPKFIYFFLKTIDFEGANSAGAVPGINRNNLKNIVVKIPDLETQKKIASILSNYDDLIQTNQQRIALLEEAAQRLYDEWFVKLRFPNHEQVPVVDGVPEGWERVTFADICESVGGGTPSTKVNEYWDNGDVSWVTPTDITRLSSLILLDTEKKITQKGLKDSSAKMLPANTILMTSRASIGYFGLIDRPVCTNQGFISIIPNNDIDRMFILFNLKSRLEEIDGLATGSTFKELSRRVFRAMSITLPTRELRQFFSDFVLPLFEQMRTITQQNQKLAQARDALLPRLMSGKMDVSGLSLKEIA